MYDQNFVNIFNLIREDGITRRKSFIKESSENKEDTPIAITNDPKFGQNILQNQIDSFKQAVHLGAKFSGENTNDPESNPLVFYPNTGNLVFSGSIPVLSGLRFQFSLNEVTGSPYIFVKGLPLTEDVITTINKIRGYYLNWKDEWLSSNDLLEKLKQS